MASLTESELYEALEYVSATAVGDAQTNRDSTDSPVLLATLELDSLAILELGIHLEDRYGVFINPIGFPIGPGSTVRDLLDYINDEASPPPS